MIARDIIVIGASAGGFDAIQTLASQLPANLKAAVFITLHLAERSKSILPQLLERVGPLPVARANDGESIENGRIYIAPPDYHLILRRGHIHLGHGPKENLQRPCINAMFRSAAAAYGERVIGIVLTGMLDDGAAGLWEIQQHGGATIVQDPEEADYPSMPQSAIRGLNVEYIVRLAEMAPLLTRLTMEEVQDADPEGEVQAFLSEAGQICPECGGVMKLAQMGHLYEYRCHVGHRFGLRTMIEEKGRIVERALWTGLAQLQELTELLRILEKDLDPEVRRDASAEVQLRLRQQELLRKVTESINMEETRL